jgi:universal stress protein A
MALDFHHDNEEVVSRGSELTAIRGADLCLIHVNEPMATDHEIYEIAKENDIDCIVLVTQGQAGIQLLLGSTANGVLHGVSCDVLTVRVGK